MYKLIAMLMFTANVCAQSIPFYQNGKQVEQVVYDKIQSTIPLFEGLNEKNVGSPFYLSVYFINKPTDGGSAAALTTGLFAASTLGIIPVVTNEDKILRYEIWLNRRSYAVYEYQTNVSDVGNLWTMADAKMDPDVLNWVLSTVDQLKLDIEQDEKIRTLLSEYEFYFAE